MSYPTFPPNNQRPVNPAEQSVDAAQRQQAMEFLQKIMQAKQTPSYVPIVKQLGQIGIKPITKDVDGKESIVIPVDELMAKEWRHMSELDAINENLGGN